MAEVFSWPEATIFLYPEGAEQTALMFGRNVHLEEVSEWSKVKSMATGAFASRTRFNLRNRYYTLDVGMLFATQSAFQMVNSATAYNARLEFNTGNEGFLLLEDGSFLLLEDGGRLILDSQQGGFVLYSGVFTQWGIAGQDNGLWSTPVSFRANDISGL